MLHLANLSVGHVSVGSSQQNARLFSYNPSLILLPPRSRALLGATYAVLLKVTNHNNCYQIKTPKPHPCAMYVGLKLLDRELQPLQGREALISWNELRQSICSRTPFEDCRLTAHGEQLLLVCKTMVRVIYLEPWPSASNMTSSSSTLLRFYPQAPLRASRVTSAERAPQISPGDAHYSAKRLGPYNPNATTTILPTGAIPLRVLYTHRLQSLYVTSSHCHSLSAHAVVSAGLRVTLHENRTEIAESKFFCGRVDSGSSLTFCGK